MTRESEAAMWIWLFKMIWKAVANRKSGTRREVVEEEGESLSATIPTQEEIRALNAFYFDVASKRLDFQFTLLRQIDQKTAFFFTTGSAVLAIVAAFLTSENNIITDCKYALVSLLIGFGFYIALVVSYVLSLADDKWVQIPDMVQFKEISLEYAVEDLQRALGDACVDAYGTNEPAIDRKAGVSAVALWTLSGEVVFLVLAVAIPLWPFSVP